MTDQETDMRLSEREEIEAMLPWYAMGRLTAEDSARVESWLDGDAELRRELQLIEEDRLATVTANEALSFDSGMGAAFFERLAAEPRQPSAAARASSLFDGVVRFFSAVTPRQAAFATFAAALVIAVQGAIIFNQTVSGPAPGDYQTASGDTAMAAADLIVGFRSEASIADIAAALKVVDGVIVAGPLSGNMFKIDIASAKTGDAEIAEAAAALKAKTDIVTIVLPAGSQ